VTSQRPVPFKAFTITDMQATLPTVSAAHCTRYFTALPPPVFLPYARDVEAMLRYLVDGSSPDCYPTGEDPEEFARDLEIIDSLHLSAA